MSVLTETVEPVADSAATLRPCEAVELVIAPRLNDLGGFTVRRVLPDQRRPMVGPWIFFDHMGPVDFAPGTGIDVRPHPHINLATVTYLFEGELVHRDSLGSVQVIRPGAVNLMIAGRGIVHSERTGPELRAAGHRVHGLQLWLALPEQAEEDAPAFTHYAADELPTATVDGVPVRVMMGEAYGVRSPVLCHSPTVYLEADLARGRSLVLPDGVGERGLYVAAGAAQVQGTAVAAGAMAVLTERAGVAVEATADTRLVLVGGAPLGPRHIWWNFVSSRAERIERAKADWREGRFAAVPGETEFIPLPER